MNVFMHLCGYIKYERECIYWISTAKVLSKYIFDFAIYIIKLEKCSLDIKEKSIGYMWMKIELFNYE